MFANSDMPAFVVDWNVDLRAPETENMLQYVYNMFTICSHKLLIFVAEFGIGRCERILNKQPAQSALSAKVDILNLSFHNLGL